jgi:hypothetical protein
MLQREVTQELAHRAGTADELGRAGLAAVVLLGKCQKVAQGRSCNAYPSDSYAEGRLIGLTEILGNAFATGEI